MMTYPTVCWDEMLWDSFSCFPGKYWADKYPFWEDSKQKSGYDTYVHIHMSALWSNAYSGLGESEA